MSPDPLTSILKKIIPRKEMEGKAAAWKQAGKAIVFTNGCFDLIHVGHIHLLAEAKAAGDLLVVGINTDASISRLKGPHRPINDEKTRALQLAALQTVDVVTSFHEDTPLELIKEIRPGLVVKGGDYQPQQVAGKEVVESYGGSVRIVRLVQGYSTSSLIEKLKK